MYQQKHVVFFETTVLIAGSISSIIAGITIKHRNYEETKKLIKKAEERKIIGITTMRVEIQARQKLDKAIKDTMEQCLKEVTNDEKKKYYESLSIILDDAERKLIKNLEMLDRLSVTSGRRIKELNRVAMMYKELSTKHRRPPPIAWSDNPRFKRLAKEITKMQMRNYQKKKKKLEEKPIIPDIIDMEILAEAVALKKDRFSNNPFYLASLDKHFAGFVEPWLDIQKEIKKRFRIICGSPKAILGWTGG